MEIGNVKSKNGICLFHFLAFSMCSCVGYRESTFSGTILFLFGAADLLPNSGSYSACYLCLPVYPLPLEVCTVPTFESHVLSTKEVCSLLFTFTSLTTLCRVASRTAVKQIAQFLFKMSGPWKKSNWRNWFDIVYELLCVTLHRI